MRYVCTPLHRETHDDVREVGSKACGKVRPRTTSGLDLSIRWELRWTIDDREDLLPQSWLLRYDRRMQTTLLHCTVACPTRRVSPWRADRGFWKGRYKMQTVFGVVYWDMICAQVFMIIYLIFSKASTYIVARFVIINQVCDRRIPQSKVFSSATCLRGCGDYPAALHLIRSSLMFSLGDVNGRPRAPIHPTSASHPWVVHDGRDHLASKFVLISTCSTPGSHLSSCSLAHDRIRQAHAALHRYCRNESVESCPSTIPDDMQQLVVSPEKGACVPAHSTVYVHCPFPRVPLRRRVQCLPTTCSQNLSTAVVLSPLCLYCT
nr:hypothetical protein CFP56_25806 [Quercus suber]